MVLGEEATLYSVDEHTRHQKLDKVRKKIPNNHRRGGQSQARISRLRDEHIHRYISLIEESCRKHFTTKGVTNIKKLILSGPAFKKEQLRDKISLGVDTELLSYGTFDEVLEHFSEILGKDRRVDNKETITEIQELLRTDSERMVFGAEIRVAFDRGELAKIWVKDTDGWDSDKTEIVTLDNYYLDDFGGKLGLKWF